MTEGRQFVVEGNAYLFSDSDFGPSVMVDGKALAVLLATAWDLEWESPSDLVGDRAHVGKARITVELLEEE